VGQNPDLLGLSPGFFTRKGNSKGMKALRSKISTEMTEIRQHVNEKIEDSVKTSKLPIITLTAAILKPFNVKPTAAHYTRFAFIRSIYPMHTDLFIESKKVSGSAATTSKVSRFWDFVDSCLKDIRDAAEKADNKVLFETKKFQGFLITDVKAYPGLNEPNMKKLGEKLGINTECNAQGQLGPSSSAAPTPRRNNPRNAASTNTGRGLGATLTGTVANGNA